MQITYTKNEILKNKQHFDTLYNTLKNDNDYNYKIIATARPITLQDYFYPTCIYKTTINNFLACDYGKSYFCWRNFGSSAIKITKKEFRWLITQIFDDCNYFTLVDKEQEQRAWHYLSKQNKQ